MDKIAVNKRIALKMFWDQGFTTEEKLLQANEKIMSIPQVSNGYWLADDISNAIEKMKK